MTQNPDNQLLNDQMADCIQNCLNSHTVCLDAASRRMEQGGQHAEHIRVMLDCSEICLTNAHLMIRNSPLYGYVCRACADVCSDCAERCYQVGEQDCGDACQASANSCQQLVKMIA